MKNENLRAITEQNGPKTSIVDFIDFCECVNLLKIVASADRCYRAVIDVFFWGDLTVDRFFRFFWADHFIQ